MNKYIAIFKVPVATMEEWRKNTPPEEMDAQSKKMEADMGAWMEKHKESFVGQGTPLGKTKAVTPNGIADTKNDLNFMMTVQANSHEEAAEIFKDCPHTQIPNSTVD